MRSEELSHLLDGSAIGNGLGTRRIGHRVIVLPEVDSTNTHALEVVSMDRELQPDGTVIFAEHQNAGRGRLGRKWLSPRGAGLNMTILLVEPRTEFQNARLMMAAGIAVLEGIIDTTDVEPAIRWPNDLYVGNRKLCGILIETRSLTSERLAVAVGIGVNCLQHESHFPPELRGRATSLEIESRQPIDRAAVARSILVRFDSLLSQVEAASDKNLAARWREWSSDLNARVTLCEQGIRYTGRIRDVHPTSGLILQLDNGVCRHFDPATTARE